MNATLNESAARTTPLPLDPRTYDRALSCVHCGLCLPACPTYTQTFHEADSPRGRIQLMRALAEGVIEPTASVRQHLDLCLDCRACETACPSGVVYHELIEETRAKLNADAKLTLQGRFMRWMFFHIFVHPRRLKLALLPARLMQKVVLYGLMRRIGLFKLLPLQLRKMEQMLPANGSIWPKRLPEHVSRSTGAPPVNDSHGRGARATKVAFFPGCIGSVMFDKVNRQAVELLAACGAEVVVPRAQGCCGAIHHHNGAWQPAAEFAKRNIDAVLPKDGPGVDRIATTIAGCGAMLRDYDHLLRDDPEYAGRAKEFASRLRDVSEVLMELGLPEMKHPVNLAVTYHDACHLAHAQKVTAAPRKLLAAIPGLRLVPLAESDMCCGAAGTYNLTQPAMATDLAHRKINHIERTGATVCATGNVGCAMHIQSEAAAAGKRFEVVH
ncbi:MAG TPA: heterodisulfide reductase-related iron-sulfur binding cluster, partial [Tepidisphaeraceae bacterium]